MRNLLIGGLRVKPAMTVWFEIGCAELRFAPVASLNPLAMTTLINHSYKSIGGKAQLNALEGLEALL
jgi:hypothetical protein